MRPSPASGVGGGKDEGGGQPRLILKLELRNPVRAPIGRGLLLKVARRVLEGEGRGGPTVLAVHLLDDAGLRRANREQRGQDSATDVLSFPLLTELQPDGAAFALPPGEPCHLGDVLISHERAAAQAAEYGHSVEREVCYLLAHGVLHLLGHDHVADEQRRTMRQREEAALRPLGLTR